MKRLLTVFVLICFCFSATLSFGFSAQAEHVTTVPSGYTGIYTTADLNNIRGDLNKNYILMNDIVFFESDFQSGGKFYDNGLGWQAIGLVTNAPTGESDQKFQGILDGNGYAVKNLHIKQKDKGHAPATQYYPLSIGIIANNAGTIKNLGVENAYFTTDGTSPPIYAGGLCGNNSGTITQCYFTGELDINGIGSSYSRTGGIAGRNSGTITDCSNYGSIKTKSSQNNYTGGITGHNSNIIKNCENFGDLSSKNPSTLCLGGIAGYSTTSNIENVRNCGNISLGDSVTAGASSYIGGIAGDFVSGTITKG